MSEKRCHEPVDKETDDLIFDYNSGVESNDDDKGSGSSEDSNSDSESEGTSL